MSDDNTPVVGHEVIVAVRTSNITTEDRKFHYIGSAATARRKGMLKTGAVKIVSITPVTEKQWHRAYGVPGVRL